MRRYILIFLTVCCCLAAACDKTSFDIDTETPVDNPAAVLIDTLTPYIEMQAADSFVTANSGVVLTGFHDDPWFGRTWSKPFFRLALPDDVIDIAANTAFDSMQLVLRFNHNYYGDTLQPVHLRVYRLTEKIEKGDRQDYYNTTSFAREANPVGEFNGLLFPAKDSIAITMNAAWGRELFTKLRSKSTDVSTQENFGNYLHGLTIEADSNVTKSIVGFTATNTQLYMRLHYHVNDVTVKKEKIDFPLKENITQFNHMQINRQQSALKRLGGNTKVSSAQLSNTAYLQPSTGVVALIKFPTLQSLKEQGKFVSVLNATLIVRPVHASYASYPLPPKLVLKAQDQYGNRGPELTDASGLSVQYGNLQIDNVYNEHTHYQYDLTNYIRQQLSASVYETTSLLLLPPAETISTRLDRLVFGDANRGSHRMELKIYVLLYK